MYQIDSREIQAISDYIFISDPLCYADAIFIPGCARPEHAIEAARLYQEGWTGLVIPSGRYAKQEGGFEGVREAYGKYGSDFSCEADFLTAVLLYHGVDAAAVFKECRATYTLENAEFTRDLIAREQLPVRSAILCCKAHHARRAYFYYHLVMPDVEIRVHPVPVDDIRKENWYRTGRGREAVFGELRRMGSQLSMMEGRIAYES